MRQAYVAGSYSHETKDGILANIRAAIDGAAKVHEAGYAPIIPHTMFHHRDTDWETAMVRCRDLIRSLDPKRDVVVLLPGWQHSRGAMEEFLIALFLGIKVLDLDDV